MESCPKCEREKARKIKKTDDDDGVNDCDNATAKENWIWLNVLFYT